MASVKIEDAIQQKVFKNAHQKAQINVLFTAAWLGQETSNVLKPQKISWQQFNILRILRGMHPEKATVKLLTNRMIDKMSNASRLVDKLLQKELVVREKSTVDGRRVDIGLTPKGLELANAATADLNKHMEELMGNFSSEDAILLSTLLDKMRGVK